MHRLFILRMAIPGLTLALYAAYPSTVQAAKTSAEERITVTATGTQLNSRFDSPSMTTVVDTTRATSQTASSAADLLRYVPGLATTGSGRTNGQTFTLRGYDQSGIVVLVDGVRQGIETGHMGGTFLDPALIKRAEVQHGAQLTGSGGLGGVISYETVDASDMLPAGQNGGFRLFSRGATGDRSSGSGASAFGRTDTFDGLLSWSSLDRGNIRSSDGSDTLNDEAIHNMLAKGSWTPDDAQRLSASLRYYHNDSEQPSNPEASQPSKRNPIVDRSTIQRDVQLGYHLNPADNNGLNASVLGWWSEININTKTPGQPPHPRKLIKQGLKINNESHLSGGLAGHRLQSGAEYYRQEQKPGTHTYGFPQAASDFWSGWLQNDMTLRDIPLSLQTGVRYDAFENKQIGKAVNRDDFWSSRGALTLTPTDWLMLYGSWTQAFRAPTLGELYRDFGHGPRVRFIPNPDLRPETSKTIEYGSGVSFHQLLTAEDKLEVKFSHFHTLADNYIAIERSSRSTVRSVNVGEAKIWGWDMTARYDNRFMRLDLGYNRTRGKNEVTGEWLPSLAPDMLVSQLDIPLSDSGFSVGVTGRFSDGSTRVKPRYASMDRLPGYALYDFSLSWAGQQQLTGLSASLVLSNAFDKTWWSAQGIVQDGRSGRFTLAWQF